VCLHATHPSSHSHLCLLKCHLIFLYRCIGSVLWQCWCQESSLHIVSDIPLGLPFFHNTHRQLFYSSMDFLRDNPGEPVPEETFTHSHPLWSSIAAYLLYPSNTIHGILPVQSTHLTIILHNISPTSLWSTSWPDTLHFILHTFLHPIIIFFLQHMPIPSQPVLL